MFGELIHEDIMEKVVHYTKVESEFVKAEGARETYVRWLITDKDGAPNFAMRLFEVKPGGNSPYHEHPYEHEIFILDGDGKVIIDGREYMVSRGFAIYIPPNAKHTIINNGKSDLKFLCMIPLTTKGK
ncbi:MAG: cupin domain-containing protein [Candidatus Verstraetearchaeota archaeon]|nr:cupin domain-containing protein [Candidatus Verstraetearchaeota archaeon]